MAPKTIVYYVLVSGFSGREMSEREQLVRSYVPDDFRLEFVSDAESPAWAATAEAATSLLADFVAGCDPDDIAAVVVSGALDPGVHEARRASPVPVIGPGEASLAVAAALDRPLSLIVIDPPTEAAARAMVARNGTQPVIASIRSTNTPAAEVMADPERVAAAITQEARAAVDEDGAGAILLACMLFSGLRIADELRAELGVPVIDPLPIALSFAVAAGRAGRASAVAV